MCKSHCTRTSKKWTLTCATSTPPKACGTCRDQHGCSPGLWTRLQSLNDSVSHLDILRVYTTGGGIRCGSPYCLDVWGKVARAKLTILHPWGVGVSHLALPVSSACRDAFGRVHSHVARRCGNVRATRRHAATTREWLAAVARPVRPRATRYACRSREPHDHGWGRSAAYGTCREQNGKSRCPPFIRL